MAGWADNPYADEFARYLAWKIANSRRPLAALGVNAVGECSETVASAPTMSLKRDRGRS